MNDQHGLGPTGTVTMSAAKAHPAYPELVRRYRTARTEWATNPQVQEAASIIGMSEREYCDRYLTTFYGTVTWTQTGTAIYPALDFERAFREAAS